MTTACGWVQIFKRSIIQSLYQRRHGKWEASQYQFQMSTFIVSALKSAGHAIYHTEIKDLWKLIYSYNYW